MLPAGERLITVALTRRARRALARAKKLPFKVHGRAIDAAGLKTALIAPVTLER